MTIIMSSSSKHWEIGDLPDDVLARVFSLLPTKDAVAASVLSSKMRRALSLITSIDINDSPISHCSDNPYLIERLPSFITFVNTVFRMLSLSEHDLCKFRFRLGRGCEEVVSDWNHRCQESCFPGLDPLLLNVWISFPMSRNIKELDICLRVRNPGQLPLELFTCETLEVLKLDVNLDVDQASHMAFFCLKKLKVLRLWSLLLPNDDFVTRLVSSCPSLEDLSLHCRWKHADSFSISSRSLRTLDLNVYKDRESNNSHVFHLDAPNLESLIYVDNLAIQTNVTYMSALVIARISISFCLQFDCDEGSYKECSFRSMLCLSRAVSNVQHLSLTGECMEALDLDEIKDQLPVFINLRHLELGYTRLTRWNKVLPAFLICSPSLKTLAFPEGLSHTGSGVYGNYDSESAKLELQFCRTTQAITWYCWSNLRSIVIQRYQGSERELELIKFILRNASVLERLITCRRTTFPVDLMSCDKTLKKLPKASITCMIEVQ